MKNPNNKKESKSNSSRLGPCLNAQPRIKTWCTSRSSVTRHRSALCSARKAGEIVSNVESQKDLVAANSFSRILRLTSHPLQPRG